MRAVTSWCDLTVLETKGGEVATAELREGAQGCAFREGWDREEGEMFAEEAHEETKDVPQVHDLAVHVDTCFVMCLTSADSW